MYKLAFILLFIISTATIVFFKFTTLSNTTKPGIVIILNGASAAGKSTLQKELQKLFPTPYLGIGLDSFFVGVLPIRFVTGPREQDDIDPELVMKGVPSLDPEGNKLFTLLVGPIGDQIMRGMHHAIAAYAIQGNNVIIDYIAYKKEWMTDLCNALENSTVYLVGVDCSLEVLEEREKARGRSFVEGHASSHYKTVHENMNNNYDLRVDTSTTSPEECARAIQEFVLKNPKPIGLKKLCTKN